MTKYSAWARSGLVFGHWRLKTFLPSMICLKLIFHSSSIAIILIKISVVSVSEKTCIITIFLFYFDDISIFYQFHKSGTLLASPRLIFNAYSVIDLFFNFPFWRLLPLLMIILIFDDILDHHILDIFFAKVLILFIR